MKARLIGFFIGMSLVAGIAVTGNWTIQEALNLLASQGRSVSGMTQQEALNVLVAQQAAAIAYEHEPLPTVTFVWDDVARELWGSTDSLFINAAPSQVKMRIRDIMHTFNIDGGIAFEAQNVLYGDTTTTSLSISMVRALKGRGWDVGTVGWNETAGMYHGNISLLANGYTTAQADTFLTNIQMAVRAQRDTLGLGMPRWGSHSNSSSALITNLAYAEAGLEFGFAPSQTATVASNNGVRPNELFPLDNARYGMWGTGGAGGFPIAAIPSQRLSRYEIMQCLGEASDSSSAYKTIRHAMQTKGLVVFIGHKPSTWEATIEGQNGFYKFLQYIDTLRDAGRIQILAPGAAADLYVNQPLSPLANVSTNNFQDYDGDGHLDWWFSKRGDSFVAADTAFLFQLAGNQGHSGKKAFSLNWAGEGNSTGLWNGQTGDASWESSKAVHCVIPPAGGGWTVQFECWFTADTTQAGWTVGASPQAGDTVGVTFAGPFEQYANRYGTGVPTPGWILDASSSYAPTVSHPIYASTTSPGGSSIVKLTARNNLHGKDEWAHGVFTWQVPEFSDYLWISIWKTAQAPAKGIVISDYSVTFYRRGSIHTGTQRLPFVF